QRLAGQVGAAQFGPGGEGVAGRQDRDAGLGKQQFGVEAALAERGTRDRDVGGAAADRGGRSAGVAEQDVHPRHPRIPGAPLHDCLDQVGAGARLDGDTETAGPGSPPAGPFERGNDSLDRNPPLLEQSTAPAGVKVTRRLVRSSSVTPSLRSSLPMAADNGGWVMPRRAAARGKFSSSATAMKYRSSPSSISSIRAVYGATVNASFRAGRAGSCTGYRKLSGRRESRWT